MENFLYAYYDETHRFIAVFKEGTAQDVLDKAKEKYDIVKTIRWFEKCN